MSNYQLNIADFYNIPIGIVKKLVPNFFDRVNDMKSKCKLIWKLATLLKVRIEAKKRHCVLEMDQSQWWKPFV